MNTWPLSLNYERLIVWILSHTAEDWNDLTWVNSSDYLSAWMTYWLLSNSADEMTCMYEGPMNLFKSQLMTRVTCIYSSDDLRVWMVHWLVSKSVDDSSGLTWVNSSHDLIVWIEWICSNFIWWLDWSDLTGQMTWVWMTCLELIDYNICWLKWCKSSVHTTHLIVSDNSPLLYFNVVTGVFNIKLSSCLSECLLVTNDASRSQYKFHTWTHWHT